MFTLKWRALATIRELSRIGILLTHKDGTFGSLLERREAAPCARVECSNNP